MGDNESTPTEPTAPTEPAPTEPEPPRLGEPEPTEPAEDVEALSQELAQLKEDLTFIRTQLGAAFRAWRLAFIALDTVKTGAPGPDVTPAAACEYISRARLVDGLAFFLEGAPLGLEAAAANQVRGLLGDPEMAFVNSELTRLRHEEAPPGSPTRELVEAQRELQQLQSELGERHDARATIALIINPHGKLTRTDNVGKSTDRDLREAPEVLVRQLTLGADPIAPELVKRAYDAATMLVNNRLATQ